MEEKDDNGSGWFNFLLIVGTSRAVAARSRRRSRKYAPNAAREGEKDDKKKARKSAGANGSR